MAYCFFTDKDLFQQQTGSNPFGPVTGSSTHDEYRAGSMHTLPSQSTPKAYACCGGLVFAQEVNSSIVNLILQPTEQPEEGLSNIEYIIYKGILRSSLFSGDEVLTSSTIRLVEIVNEAQEKRFGSQNTPAAPKGALGLHITSTDYADTENIEKLFHHGGDMQPPTVLVGNSLGEFDPTLFGIQIVCKRLGNGPPLAAARTVDYKVQVLKPPTQPTSAETFLNKHGKEELLYYVDPAAFYGGMYAKGISYRVSNSSALASLDPDQFYDEILSYFTNKNIVYLDIRNDQNYSINYYGNYGDTINLGYGKTSTPAGVNYYADGWPLFRINVGSIQFPTGNSAVKNILKLSFPLNTENVLPLLVVHNGRPDKKPSNDQRFPTIPQQAGNFIELIPAPNAPTVPIIVNLAIHDKSGSSTVPIGEHIKLAYVHLRDAVTEPAPPASGVLRPGALHYADNLFPVFEMVVPYADDLNNPLVRVKTFPEEIYVDDPKYTREEFTVTLGTAIDNENYTFFATPSRFKTSIGSALRKALVVKSAEIKGEDDFLKYVAYVTGNHILTKRTIVPGQSLPDLHYIAYEAQNFYPDTTTQYVSLNDFISITITRSEYAQLVSAKSGAGFEPGYRVYMGLNIVPSESGQDELWQLYRTYEITLRGYKVQSNSLVLDNISTGIKVVTYGSK